MAVGGGLPLSVLVLAMVMAVAMVRGMVSRVMVAGGCGWCCGGDDRAGDGSGYNILK